MQLHTIHRFLQLCEDKNMLRCSERLNISQQGLSRHIRAMEDELGVSLFARNSRGVSLTPEGEMVLPYFEEIWRQYDCACAALRSRNESQPMHLGFTFSSTYATGLNFVLNYQTLHPEASIQISSMSNDSCEQRLLEGTLDAALITYPEHADQFETVLVFESPVCAVLNRGHHLAGRSSVNLDDLAGETIFMPNGQYRMRQLFDACFQHMHSRFKNVFSSGEHTEYIKLPISVPGVALTFDFLCGNLPPELVRIPMEEDFPNRIYFCVNKNRPSGRQLRDFTQYVQATLGIAEDIAQRENLIQHRMRL